mmetsp:Transcript_98052/g.277950  ORF Transcript_98052/g.277950 Transcript_98052/m.277950 type:complete len:107 (+) Transcript_98052:172-492(+)
MACAAEKSSPAVRNAQDSSRSHSSHVKRIGSPACSRQSRSSCSQMRPSVRPGLRRDGHREVRAEVAPDVPVAPRCLRGQVGQPQSNIRTAVINRLEGFELIELVLP